MRLRMVQLAAVHSWQQYSWHGCRSSPPIPPPVQDEVADQMAVQFLQQRLPPPPREVGGPISADGQLAGQLSGSRRCGQVYLAASML